MLGENLRILLHGRPPASSTILVSGSARSGTSWLGGLLARTGGVQQIFEPLSPPNSPTVRRLTGWDSSNPVARSQYLRPDSEYPEWHVFLEKVLTGQYRHYVTDYVRTSYWPSRYLIKGIRFNMMLGYVYDAFQPAIVYLVRHPCAVVYSRLHRERGDPWQANVHDILRQDQLMEDYLRPWAGKIEREQDLIGANAVWWAVENMVASSELAARPHLRIHYEDICLEPQAAIAAVAESLSLESGNVNLLDFMTNSRTAAVRHEQTTSARLAAWKQGLTEEDQRRIIFWARELGLPWYDNNILPTDSRRLLEEWDSFSQVRVD
jgi:hypothetical protein